MKPSKDLNDQIEEILNKCPYSQASQACVKFHQAMQSTEQRLLALIEQREREARIDELNRIAVAVEDRRTADSFDGRVYVTKLSNIDDRIEALQKGEL